MEKMIFYINGKKKAWVWIDPSQKENMETMMERVARYIAPCGIDLQFATEKKG